jgi:hypothetical protein
LLAHSHNDYQQARPLADALDNGSHSVEADIWLEDGEILVSHLGLRFVGSLRDLYLEPLQALATGRGSLFGDGEPVYLWLDIKTSAPEMHPALRSLLSRYPMLRGRRAPVVAILTGDEGSKRAYVEGPEPLAVRDSNDFYADDPPHPLWHWYALCWGDYFRWDGNGAMPPDERAGLRALIAAIHARSRRIRFWDTPDSEALWTELLDAGADLIGSDNLPRLRRFLEQQERARRLLGMGSPVRALRDSREGSDAPL